MKTIYEKLKAVSDKDYKEFQAKLVPNISSDTIIGVRTPAMREIAKEIFKSGEYEEFLDSLPHKWYEENLVHFFVIGLIKDFDECIKRTEQFLPYVDCWPVSDQSSPKAFKKYHAKLIPYLEDWVSSQYVYTARFGIRMYMNEFLDEHFDKSFPEYISFKAAEAVKRNSSGNIKGGIDIPSEASDDYYHRMMVAWYFATALAKQYDDVIKYMEKDYKGDITPLDEWTRRKSIQKALESIRVSDEHKAYLRSLK